MRGDGGSGAGNGTGGVRTAQNTDSAQVGASCNHADCRFSRTLHPSRVSDACAVVAAVLDAILRERGAPSNREIAEWCGVDESTVRKWRDGRKRIPYTQRVMGHKDIRTTQRYAHLAPSVLTQVAADAHEAWAVKGPSRGGGGSGGGGASVAFLNRRPRVRDSASAQGKNKRGSLPFTRVRDGVVTAIVGALRAIERRDYEGAALALEPALDALLASYDDAASEEAGS